MSFEADAYLERIGHTGPLLPNADSLEAVHRAQAYTIPFENFDVLLGRGIDLAPDAIFDKLVRRRRGGYCFELNGLLRMALTAFGFEVRPLLARVHLSGEPSGRGHMLLLVSLDDATWICDVGFGGPGLRAPIPLEFDAVAQQDGQRFRLLRNEDFGHMLQTGQQDGWQDLYSFDLGRVVPADIAMGNHFTSTHPSSFFTYRRVAALPRPDGRLALYDLRLSTVHNGELSERELSEGEAFYDALRQQFGIELTRPDEELPPLAID